ncbi:hypothetical protein Q5P01_005605 [Channa striata]|uniref:Uncharacterized protein n=1 Tax=Channa striata TaxID=64152 RepID=A0AA88T1G2_CHASR|nr:hypothetical protein Q5P01_005605 [Channa striata]
MSAERGAHTYIKSLGTEALNVCDSTNSAIMAILNTSNPDRYRAPVFIRLDSDSAYVILQPASDFRESKTSAEVRQPDGSYKAVNAVWVG